MMNFRIQEIQRVLSWGEKELLKRTDLSGITSTTLLIQMHLVSSKEKLISKVIKATLLQINLYINTFFKNKKKVSINLTKCKYPPLLDAQEKDASSKMMNSPICNLYMF